MRTTSNFVVATLVAMLTACGGGGGSDSNSGAPGNQNPPPLTIINPVTGASAGTATTRIDGTVTLSRAFGYADQGATVTAYSVQPDGSSGAALGPSATTDASGSFTLNLTSAPTSWVRLVATGGSQKRFSDLSIQPGGTMELVTPAVGSSFRTFKISPLTDIAAHVMRVKASGGATLVDAFKAGMHNMLELDAANTPVLNDVSTYMYVLRGSIKSDLQLFGAQSTDLSELLGALDWFGVMYDLPSQDVRRVIAAAAENEYPLSSVNGAGNAITAGAWGGGVFNPNAPVSLKTMMDAMTPATYSVTDPVTHNPTSPSVATVVSKYLISDFIVDYACTTGITSILLSRNPFYALDGLGHVPAAECTAVTQRLADLQGRVATNNSTNMH